MFCRVSMLCVAVLTGCGESFEDPEAAQEEAEVPATEASLSALLADELDMPAEASVDELAFATADRVKASVTPQGCVTVTLADATATYVFVDCTGKYGLVKLNGTATVTYAQPGNGVTRAVIAATGFKANDATFDVKTTLEGTQEGSTRRANITSETTATGTRGLTIKRDGSFGVVWDQDTECFRLDGSSDTSRGTTTTVSNFKWCKAQCPTSGTVVHATARNRSVTLVFDGTAEAAWTSATGRKGTLPLRCGQ